MRSYLALLRRRPGLRYLWLAQAVSLAGDWFNAIATVILINRYAGSGLAISALFLARYLPTFFAGPIAGVIADRVDRKLILIASDLLRAAIVLGFLLVDRPERVWLVYVLSVAQFIVSAFFQPAVSAIVPQLVSEDELITTNTLAGVTYSAMLVLGAAIGGAVAAVFGAQTALIVDSASFVVSAALLWKIGPAGTPVRGRASVSGWRDLIEGVTFARRQPEVGPIVLVKGLGQLGNVDVIAAVLAAGAFSLGRDGGGALGLMLSALGVGTILGPPLGNLFHQGSSASLQRAIAGGFALIAVSWFLIGASPWFLATLAALVLRGAGGSLNWVYSDVLIQMKVPNELRGRVFSLNLAFFTLVVSASTLATGYLLDRSGMDPWRYSIWVGVVSLAPLLAWWLATRRAGQER